MISRASAIAILLSVALWADTAAGIHWTTPPTWKAQAARPMRVATYTVPKAAVDSEDGECAIFFFGPGQGGAVDLNLKRWISQFEGGEKTAKTGKRTIHGLNVTTVDISGAYGGMGGPMAQTKSVKQNYRLLGAIVEAPEGNVFFKLTGPVKTVVANQPKFDALLNSVAR